MRSEKTKQPLTVFMIISAVIFLIFAALAFLFPYSGDDWAWGSDLGIERFNNFFSDYNGRYAGNLLVLLLTRSRFFKILLMALTNYLLCLSCYKYTSHKKNISLLFSFVLFLSMPRAVFAQTVVWTSGFANYVPPTLISIIYVLIVKNLTFQTKSVSTKYMFIPTFLLGFVGALFIETSTLFNCVLGIGVIIFNLIKFRKIYFSHISFFIGSVVGAFCMFSNGAYSAIAAGTDNYRDATFDKEELLSTYLEHRRIIYENLFLSNGTVCSIICVLLIITTVLFILKNKSFARLIASLSAITLNVISLILILLRYALSLSRPIQLTCAIVFIISLLLVVLICVEKSEKSKLLLPLFSILLLVMPLLVVKPIGPRCLFAPFIMLVVFTVYLFSYIINDISSSDIKYKSLFSLFSITIIVQASIYASIFMPIYKYDSIRNALAVTQSENGEKTVIISELPNTKYLWTPDPHKEPWVSRYKLFWNLYDETELKIVKPREFDIFCEKYLKS